MRKLVKNSAVQIWFLILFTTLSNSQYQKRVDGEGIKNSIAILSSDTYQGRETGTKFGDQSEEFFAKAYEKAGLKPVGQNGSFYHYYFLTKDPIRKVEGTPNFVVEDRKFYYGRDDDFREAPFTDGGDISAEVVYIDFGIYAPDQQRNDFDKVDIKNKIVLAKRGCPNDDWAKWKNVATDSAKAEYCSKNGAIGMLLFEPTTQTQIQMMSLLGIQNQTINFQNSLSSTKSIANFPVLLVDQRVARFLGVTFSTRFNFSGNRPQQSESKPTGKTAKISLKINIEIPKKVRNVLAMIPGTDSKLKNEVVMIGGHLDHLGVNPKGDVFNGADDNASGSSVALGVAQAMMKNKFKPKRTIIFAGWSGEEKGLLGSKAWNENPTWDVEKIVVYFNLDMVGLGSDTLDFPGIYYSEDVWKFLKENSKQDYLSRINPGKGGPGGSDQTHFLYNGVPAFAGMTGGLQTHPDYHQIGDDIEKIKTSLLQFVGDWMYHCIDLLANTKENLITKDRNHYVKYLMANAINFNFIKESDLKAAKEDRNLNSIFVNYTDGFNKNESDKNFITILRKMEELNKANSANSQNAMMAQVSRRRGGSRGPQVVPTVNLGIFNYDETFCKVLAKNGAKIGFIENDISSVNNTGNEKLIQNIIDAGMVVVLKNLSKDELTRQLNQIEKPVGIIISDISTLTDDVISKIKTKEHLLIYSCSNDISSNEIIKNIEIIKNKIEAKNIFVTSSSFDKVGMDKIKEIYIATDGKFPKDNFATNIFATNFTNFMTRATPPPPQLQLQRGR